MADAVDAAQAAEALYLATAVHAAGRRLTDGQVADETGRLVCRDCGEPLSRARLEAVPWASRCVECQEAEDAHG